MLKNAVIMGNIYDLDTDCQYVLMRVTARDWDQFQKENEDLELPELPKKKPARFVKCIKCGHIESEYFSVCPKCEAIQD